MNNLAPVGHDATALFHEVSPQIGPHRGISHLMVQANLGLNVVSFGLSTPVAKAGTDAMRSHPQLVSFYQGRKCVGSQETVRTHARENDIRIVTDKFP